MKLVLEACSARHPAASAAAPPALKKLSVALASGEQVAVIGPSGAGKTTLLQLMACALKPSQGRLQLGDHAPWQMRTSALQQLRLAAPQDAILVTGIKRDVSLLRQVPCAPHIRVTVLDISLDQNRQPLLALLHAGAQLTYFDHHHAGELPARERSRERG